MKLVSSILAAIVTLWAIFEAYRRRAPFYWYPIIVLLPWPLGGLIYFAALNWRKLQGLGSLNLTALEQGVTREPTPENRLALADALEARGQPGRAEVLYRSILLQDPQNLRALHGLGRSLMSLGRFDDASDCLAQVMMRDSAYANYSAALDYAEALSRGGDNKGAISLLDGLVTVEPRINHRLALAHYLVEDGQNEVARAELKRALEDFATSSPTDQRRTERWAKRAKTMLAELALKHPLN